MNMPAERVQEILGLKGARGGSALAAAVEKGLPRSALVRVVGRAGLTGKARDALMYRVVPLATFKRRTRLKFHESEKTERLARVIALAELLWDDQPAAQRFLNTPHPELAGRTPLESAGSELGAREVEDIVNRALYGLPV
jgi:putative toxin-antitoxin system antitoxin component (TIGR02293 family)